MVASLECTLRAKRKALDFLIKEIDSKVKPRGRLERVAHLADESARENYYEEHIFYYVGDYFNLASRLRFEVKAESEYISVDWSHKFGFDNSPRHKPADILDIDLKKLPQAQLREMSGSAVDLHEYLYKLSKTVSGLDGWHYEIGFYRLVELKEN